MDHAMYCVAAAPADADDFDAGAGARQVLLEQNPERLRLRHVAGASVHGSS
jgi:hypothetical protein